MAKLFDADKMPENSMVRAKQAEAEVKQAERNAWLEAGRVEKTKAREAMQLQAIINSRSWRITRPLRWFVKQCQLLKRDGVISRLKVALKKLILKIIFVLRRYSMIRQPAIMLLKITGLQQPILNLYMQNKPDIRSLVSTKITELKDLTPRSSQIYSDLQDALAKQKNKRRRG